MQFYTTVALLAAVAAPLVSAQDLSQLPPCALTPALSSITGTGCGVTDVACICKNTAFLSSLQPIITTACSPSDLAKTLAVAQSFCQTVGITLNIPSAPASSSAAPPSSSAAASSSSAAPSPSAAAPSSSVVAVTTAPPASSSAAAVPSTSATPSTTGQAVVSVIGDGQLQVPTGVSNITINSTTPSPKPSPYVGAAASMGAQLISVAMLVGTVGVFVAL